MHAMCYYPYRYGTTVTMVITSIKGPKSMMRRCSSRLPTNNNGVLIYDEVSICDEIHSFAVVCLFVRCVWMMKMMRDINSRMNCNAIVAARITNKQ